MITMVEFGSNIELEEKLEEWVESVESAQGVVHYSMPYALYIELPTDYDDKKPPLEPIKEWVKRNIMIDFDDGETIESVAFAVQNAIYENGTEGVFFASNTLDDFAGGRWQHVARKYSDDPEPQTVPERFVEDLLDEMLADTQFRLGQADKIDTGALMDSGIYIMNIDPDDFSADTIEIQ